LYQLTKHVVGQRKTRETQHSFQIASACAQNIAQ